MKKLFVCAVFLLNITVSSTAQKVGYDEKFGEWGVVVEEHPIDDSKLVIIESLATSRVEAGEVQTILPLIRIFCNKDLNMDPVLMIDFDSSQIANVDEVITIKFRLDKEKALEVKMLAHKDMVAIKQGQETIDFLKKLKNHDKLIFSVTNKKNIEMIPAFDIRQFEKTIPFIKKYCNWQ